MVDARLARATGQRCHSLPERSRWQLSSADRVDLLHGHLQRYRAFVTFGGPDRPIEPSSARTALRWSTVPNLAFPRPRLPQPGRSATGRARRLRSRAIDVADAGHHRGRRHPLDPHRVAADRPTATGSRDHFDFHPLDYEDVYSRNNRPEARPVRRLRLHRPALPAVREGDRADPDRRARPVHGSGLPDHAAEHPAPAADRDVRALPREGATCARRPSRRAPATCSTRSSTPASTRRSRCCARWR